MVKIKTLTKRHCLQMKNVITITPSWLFTSKKDWTRGIARLEEMGLRVINKKFITRLPSPEGKAAQLHRAFLNSKAGIILAQRGGASSMKMLKHVNFDIIKKHPKVFAGFSDLSTLLNAIYERTGQVTLHAPMVINFSKASRFTATSFLNAINGFTRKNLFSGAPVNVYREGTATGTLKGGNLVTLTTLIGTPWEIPTDGAILFLEDVDEKLHEVDRYLSQWILAGKFKRLKGLILGDFRGIKSDDVYRMINGMMRVTFPVLHCPYIGHVKNKITLPVGAKVALDTRAKTLSLVGQ